MIAYAVANAVGAVRGPTVAWAGPARLAAGAIKATARAAMAVGMAGRMLVTGPPAWYEDMDVANKYQYQNNTLGIGITGPQPPLTWHHASSTAVRMPGRTDPTGKP